MPLITVPSPRIQLPTPLERRWQALRLLEGRVQDAVEKTLQAEHGVSASEYAALAALAYSDDGGHLRQQILADAIPLTQSSVSRLVGRLEKLGLTERYLCVADRRGVYTQITEQGRALVAAAHDTYLRALDAALDQAAQDEHLGPVVAHIRSDSPAPRGEPTGVGCGSDAVSGEHRLVAAVGETHHQLGRRGDQEVDHRGGAG